MTTKINYKRVLLISAIIAPALVYMIKTVMILADPTLRTSLDYIALYTAGQIFRTRGPQDIYNIQLQSDIENALRNTSAGIQQTLLYNHVPIMAPILAVLSAAPYVLSFAIWMLLLLALLFTSILLLSKILPDYPRPETRLIILGGLLFPPVFDSILNGQDTALVMLGTVLFLIFMNRKQDILAGLSLTMLALRPQMALFFILPLALWSKKALLGYLGGGIAMGLLSFLMIGWQGTLDFINILKISSGNDWFGMSVWHMFNLLGLVVRLFPSLPIPAVSLGAWLVFCISLPAFGLFFWLSPIPAERKFGLGLVIFTLVSPHLHYHDLTLLLVPLFIALRQQDQNGSFPKAVLGLLPITLSVITLVCSFSVPAYFDFPYLLMAALIAILLANRPLKFSFALPAFLRTNH